MPTWPSPRSERLGTPKIPAIRFTRGSYFGASRFTYATACQVARPPLTDRTRSPQPQRAFTSRLPAVWSPSLPLDITTTWTGLLVLAGLTPAGMAASLAAPDPDEPNSSIRLLPWVFDGEALQLAVRGSAPGSRVSGSGSGACFAGPRFPWPLPLAPPPPQPAAQLCSAASQLLWQSLTSPNRASVATAPRLPTADRPPSRAFGRSGDLPVPVQGACVHARFSDHAGLAKCSRWRSWTYCLPLHRQCRHPGSLFYRGSMAGLHVPLPTLRRHPRGCLRTAWGRCGSLLLHRSGLGRVEVPVTRHLPHRSRRAACPHRALAGGRT